MGNNKEGNPPQDEDLKNGIWEYSNGEYREKWLVRDNSWLQLKTAKVHRLEDIRTMLPKFRWVGKEGGQKRWDFSSHLKEDFFDD
tara:strand:- start:144 stop:398 length:255 start_codon:yes stop_codon:yes gene_type:complete